jgi:hypothetical protein
MLISSFNPERQEPLFTLFDCFAAVSRALSDPKTRKSLILEYIVEARVSEFRRFSKDLSQKIRRYPLSRGRILFRKGNQTIPIKRDDLFHATSARRVDMLMALTKTFGRYLSYEADNLIAEAIFAHIREQKQLRLDDNVFRNNRALH